MFFISTVNPSRERGGLEINSVWGVWSLFWSSDSDTRVRYYYVPLRLFVKGVFVAHALAPFWHPRIYSTTFRFRVTPVFVRGPVYRVRRVAEGTRLLDFQITTRTLLGKFYYSTEQSSSCNFHLFCQNHSNIQKMEKQYFDDDLM